MRGPFNTVSNSLWYYGCNCTLYTGSLQVALTYANCFIRVNFAYIVDMMFKMLRCLDAL